MSRDWSYGEVLKAVFPLLDGTDLTACMLVSRQWRDIASDDYLWKCICAKRWPSICKKPPPSLSYHKLFLAFCKPRHKQSLLPPKLTFKDLEFYFDIWSDDKLIFSESICGPNLRLGIKNLPPGVSDVLKSHIDNPDYKMMMQVEPRFTIPLGQSVAASVLVCRKDTDQIACILHKSKFDYVDGTAFRALAYDYLTFSPCHPFVSGIRAWISLLFLANNNDGIIDVFGIEMDFCDAASSENEVLWLLEILDWK